MNSFEREMGVRRNGDWDLPHGAVATAIALPAQGAGSSMREMVIVARETAMVLLIQIAFRAMLLLRRWNY